MLKLIPKINSPEADIAFCKASFALVLGLARTGLIFTGIQEGAQPGGGG